MVGMRRTLVAVLAMAVIAPLGLTACGGKDEAKADAAPAATKSAAADPVTESVQAAPIELAVSPATGKTDLPVSTEIGFKVSGAKVTTVTLKGADGKAVSGALRDDGSSWVPKAPLKTKQKYTASIVATADNGQTKSVSTSFTTMGAPAKKTGTGLYLFTGKTYGVAMPVVVEFTPGIKKADRAAVQKRMFVQTDPPQPGVWAWTANGSQAYYRGPEFWKSGTTLTVRVAVGGLPTGGGRYGDRDRSATSKIGRKFVMNVDNKTKKMTVQENGKTVKTMPVSLGKASTPSSSGTMVVMDKLAQTVFDTTAELGPVNGYRTEIQYAQRLTWSGQYIHSAPWSVGSQGRSNVSHGCVNVSPSNARWLFDKTMVGDPVTVKGTGDKLEYGNGWTAWNVSWSEFIKGSALPVPESLQ
jgi:lipoprotein-anchoring transpeptidase ErfK/SrfK